MNQRAGGLNGVIEERNRLRDVLAGLPHHRLAEKLTLPRPAVIQRFANAPERDLRRVPEPAGQLVIDNDAREEGALGHGALEGTHFEQEPERLARALGAEAPLEDFQSTAGEEI